MIREPTVLILGAGASRTYGFPLGGELVDLILPNLFEEAPNPALLQALGRLGIRLGDIEVFREGLQASGLRSIDLFLEDLEPDDVYVQIGKVAIAHTVLCHETRDKFFGANKAKAHWYEYVWNLMRPGASTGNLHENGLKIITFNYDRSFEYYFTTAIQHSFRLPRWEDAQSLFQAAVPVVHVHGEVGSVEMFGTHIRPLPRDVVRKAAADIRVVHDPTATDDPRFKQARELISKVRRVAFVGFGYHPRNLARLDVPRCFPREVINQGGPHASAFEMARTQIALAEIAVDVPVRFADPSLDARRFFQEFLALT